MEYFLSILLFFPIIGIVGLSFVQDGVKFYSFSIAFLELAGALALYFFYDTNIGGMQFIEKIPLIKEYGVSYYIGVDGISLLLVLITTFSTLIVLALLEEDFNKNSVALLFFLESVFLGIFLSLDAVLFYIFWELMLIPLFFSLQDWESKIKVAMFIIYFLISSLLLLFSFGMVAYIFHQESSQWSFSILHWYALIIPEPLNTLLFIVMVVALFLKVPLFPFLSWLKIAFEKSSPAGALLLTTLMVVVAFYATIRVAFPIFAHAIENLVSTMVFFAVIIASYAFFALLQVANLKEFIFYKSFYYIALIILYLFSLEKPFFELAFLLVFFYVLLLIVDLYLLELYLKREESNKKLAKAVAKSMPKYSFLLIINTLFYFLLPLFLVYEFIGFNDENLTNILLIAFSGFFSFLFLLAVLKFFAQNFFAKKEKVRVRDMSTREFLVTLFFIVSLTFASFYSKNSFVAVKKSSVALIDFIYKKANRGN